jgi:hypothetical protein
LTHNLVVGGEPHDDRENRNRSDADATLRTAAIRPLQVEQIV